MCCPVVEAVGCSEQVPRTPRTISVMMAVACLDCIVMLRCTVQLLLGLCAPPFLSPVKPLEICRAARLPGNGMSHACMQGLLPECRVPLNTTSCIATPTAIKLLFAFEIQHVGLMFKVWRDRGCFCGGSASPTIPSAGCAVQLCIR
jgi:hypothetical protein